jgi:hypothetical protein
VFRVALAQPEKVLNYDVPSLPDSATAAAFHTCTGWPDWPRVRPRPSFKDRGAKP